MAAVVVMVGSIPYYFAVGAVHVDVGQQPFYTLLFATPALSVGLDDRGQLWMWQLNMRVEQLIVCADVCLIHSMCQW